MSRASTYRIGSGAGYSGDRIDPAQDLAERMCALARVRCRAQCRVATTCPTSPGYLANPNAASKFNANDLRT